MNEVYTYEEYTCNCTIWLKNYHSIIKNIPYTDIISLNTYLGEFFIIKYSFSSIVELIYFTNEYFKPKKRIDKLGYLIRLVN